MNSNISQNAYSYSNKMAHAGSNLDLFRISHI